MNDQIIPVTFHGDTLALVDHEGEPFVAMKPMAENMGLDWTAQYKKLTERFGATIAVTAMVGEDGRQREMVCLPLRKLPAWLYSIVPSRVKPELRDKIIRYQEECDDVLWKYWTQGYVERGGVKRPSISQQLSAHGVRLRLLKDLKAETDPELRKAIHQQLDHASRLIGIDTPALDSIGRAEAPQAVPALVETFWDLVDVIGLDTLNHSRDPRLIAIRMYDFEEAASKIGARIPPLTEYYRALRSSQSPRFITIKPVNSRLIGKSVRCWVFEDVADV